MAKWPALLVHITNVPHAQWTACAPNSAAADDHSRLVGAWRGTCGRAARHGRSTCRRVLSQGLRCLTGPARHRRDAGMILCGLWQRALSAARASSQPPSPHFLLRGAAAATPACSRGAVNYATAICGRALGAARAQAETQLTTLDCILDPTHHRSAQAAGRVNPRAFADMRCGGGGAASSNAGESANHCRCACMPSLTALRRRLLRHPVRIRLSRRCTITEGLS